MSVSLVHVGALAVLLSAILGWWGRRRAAWWERAFVIASPTFIYLVLGSALIGARTEHHVNWDAARLGAVVAAWRGFAVYDVAGPVQTVMYPPGWLLAYGPVAGCDTPAGVLTLGNAMAQAYAFLPVLLLAQVCARRRATALVLAACFVYAACRLRPLYEGCFFPHADAPALGLALLATIALWCSRHATPPSTRWLYGAACLSAMAVACKQVMVPILPAIACWLCARRQYRDAVRFLGASLLAGILLMALSAWRFGLDGLLLNLVRIPGGHDWVGTTPFNLLRSGSELLSLALMPLIILALGSAWATASAGWSGVRQQLATRAWGLPAILAISLIPLSLMGRVKVGGALNSLAPPLYFLVAALLALYAELLREPVPSGLSPASRPILKRTSAAVLAMVAIVWGLDVTQSLRYGLPDPRRSLPQQAFDYLSSTGANAYFPGYPLAHLLDENRLYHFTHAVGDRELRGHIPLAPGQGRAHVPAEATIVCWTRNHLEDERRDVGRYLPGFTVPVAIPELPDFSCYTRPPDWNR